MIRFDGFEVYIIPDDDAEAVKLYPFEVLAAATQTAVAMGRGRMYVRRTLWERMKPELERLTRLDQ